MIYQKWCIIQLEVDDTFTKSIRCFYECVNNSKVRTETYEALLHQERLVEEFMKLAGMKDF